MPKGTNYRVESFKSKNQPKSFKVTKPNSCSLFMSKLLEEFMDYFIQKNMKVNKFKALQFLQMRLSNRTKTYFKLKNKIKMKADNYPVAMIKDMKIYKSLKIDSITQENA